MMVNIKMTATILPKRESDKIFSRAFIV